MTSKTWRKPLSSWKQTTLPSFLITYYKAELPACHFTHKQLIRVVENDLDMSLNMSLGTDITCSNLNQIILGGEKASEKILTLQRQRTTPILPMQPLLPGVASLRSFGCKTATNPSLQQCPLLLSCLFSAHFSIAGDWAYHITAVNRGFCSLPLPCKRASSLSAD